ncbi:MAG TPA: hypothetical protein ENI51_09245 [Candidatus Atribacteria bacterium]|nr:hypothetical protein [Candidatus Atribacteria bacterium]
MKIKLTKGEKVAWILFFVFLGINICYEILIELDKIDKTQIYKYQFLSILILLPYPAYIFYKWTKKYDILYEKYGIEAIPERYRISTPSGKYIPFWDIIKTISLFCCFVTLTFLIIGMTIYNAELFVDLRESANYSQTDKQILWVLIGLVFGTAFSVLFQGINPELNAKTQARILSYYFSFYLLFLLTLNIIYSISKHIIILFFT